MSEIKILHNYVSHKFNDNKLSLYFPHNLDVSKNPEIYRLKKWVESSGMKFKEINAQPTVFSNSLLTFVNEPPKDFNFDTYIYWLALKNNFKVKRDFYNFPPREYGESKWDFGLSSKIKFSISLLKYFFKLKKTNKSYSQ